jgi:hypothetical protein
VAAAAAWSACGPPPAAVEAPGSADGSAAGDPASVEADHSADDPFRAVLAALAGGSARAVREFVPAGGRLVVLTDICQGPIDRMRCGEHEVDAERRMISDELLAPWQDAAAMAVAAAPGGSLDAQAVSCTESRATWTCSTVLALGFDACRGDQTATIEAVLVRDGEQWWLERLSVAREILICN